MDDASDLNDLTQHDRITARFGPLGLMTSQALTPEGSAVLLADAVRAAVLSPSVPEDVQRSFGRVRDLFRYGMFRYEFFTLADQMAWTLPETALGVCFVERYGGRVPLARLDQTAIVETERFRVIAEALGPRGPYSHRGGWRLLGHEGVGNARSFNGSFRGLIDWAYAERLLLPWLDGRWDVLSPGIAHAVLTQARRPTSTKPFVAPIEWAALEQSERKAWFDEFQDGSAVPDNWSELSADNRAAWFEDYRRLKWERQVLEVLVDLRNFSAHADAGALLMPPQAAQSIHSVAAFINGLWTE